MGHAPAPELLTSSARFEPLLSRLGATADPSSLFAQLAAAWAEPRRVYHTTAHLADCLDQLELAPAGSTRDLAEAALWFHDAVYDPRAADNEERSAAWARRALPELGVPAATADAVARLVLETRHAGPPTDPAAALVCDVDLSILGRAPEEYDEFERRIRREYAFVPDPVFRRERARILSGFLARTPLYHTPVFHDRYEHPARANLARAVARLGGP